MARGRLKVETENWECKKDRRKGGFSQGIMCTSKTSHMFITLSDDTSHEATLFDVDGCSRHDIEGMIYYICRAKGV